MRVVLQRVTEASVVVGDRVVGSIGPGLALLVGFRSGDGPDHVRWMADKVLGLRVFSDDDGKMNRSVADAAADVLIVSQFTLYGSTRKGRRPSFVAAADPEVAEPLYEAFVAQVRSAAPAIVATGEFGATMSVRLVNDGPVTLILERE